MAVKCVECPGALHLRRGSKGKFYGCENYPICQATMKAHPDGKPVGYPGDQETRLLRVRIHGLLNAIWNYEDPRQRDEMYSFLKENAYPGHIGKLYKKDLVLLENRLRELKLLKT